MIQPGLFSDNENNLIYLKFQILVAQIPGSFR